jgi:hypothetical protein
MADKSIVEFVFDESHEKIFLLWSIALENCHQTEKKLHDMDHFSKSILQVQNK